MSTVKLSARDLSILDLIFDSTQCEKDVKDLTRPIQDEIDCKDVDEGKSAEILKSVELEVEGVTLTESGKLDEALDKFSESIKISDRRPSPYNNRAQLYRFMEKDDREFVGTKSLKF